MSSRKKLMNGCFKRPASTCPLFFPKLKEMCHRILKLFFHVFSRNNSDVVKVQPYSRIFTCIRWPENSSSHLAKHLMISTNSVLLKSASSLSKMIHRSFQAQIQCKCTFKLTSLLFCRLVIWWQIALWLCAPAPDGSQRWAKPSSVSLWSNIYDYDSE